MLFSVNLRVGGTFISGITLSKPQNVWQGAGKNSLTCERFPSASTQPEEESSGTPEEAFYRAWKLETAHRPEGPPRPLPDAACQS